MRTPKSLPAGYAWGSSDDEGDNDVGYVDIQADPKESYLECGATAPEYAVPSPVRNDHYVELQPGEPEYAECLDNEGRQDRAV